MRRTALALLAAISLATAMAPSAAASHKIDPLVEKLSSVRAQHGLPGLRQSPSLSRSARRFASHLMATDQFTHAPQIQASRRFDRLGEIIAFHNGRRARRSRTVRNWMASPGHRSVILDPSLRWVGAGRAVGHLWGAKRTIWVVQLGRL